MEDFSLAWVVFGVLVFLIVSAFIGHNNAKEADARVLFTRESDDVAVLNGYTFEFLPATGQVRILPELVNDPEFLAWPLTVHADIKDHMHHYDGHAGSVIVANGTVVVNSPTEGGSYSTGFYKVKLRAFDLQGGVKEMEFPRIKKLDYEGFATWMTGIRLRSARVLVKEYIKEFKDRCGRAWGVHPDSIPDEDKWFGVHLGGSWGGVMDDGEIPDTIKKMPFNVRMKDHQRGFDPLDGVMWKIDGAPPSFSPLDLVSSVFIYASLFTRQGDAAVILNEFHDLVIHPMKDFYFNLSEVREIRDGSEKRKMVIIVFDDPEYEERNMKERILELPVGRVRARGEERELADILNIHVLKKLFQKIKG